LMRDFILPTLSNRYILTPPTLFASGGLCRRNYLSRLF
jgi:hypothetical protein